MPTVYPIVHWFVCPDRVHRIHGCARMRTKQSEDQRDIPSGSIPIPDQRKLWRDMRGWACALRMRGGLSADQVVKHRETCSTACPLVVTRKCLKFRRATCIRNSQFRHYILCQSLDSTAWVCGWWPTCDITTGLKARCNDETESGNNIISGLNKPLLVFQPPNLASYMTYTQPSIFYYAENTYFASHTSACRPGHSDFSECIFYRHASLYIHSQLVEAFKRKNRLQYLKLNWRSRLIKPTIDRDLKSAKMHLWFKFGKPNLNLCWLITWRSSKCNKFWLLS